MVFDNGKKPDGFLIFVPSKQKDDDSNNEITSDEDVKFYSATVFDISQTESISDALKSENVDTYLVEAN